MKDNKKRKREEKKMEINRRSEENAEAKKKDTAEYLSNIKDNFSKK